MTKTYRKTRSNLLNLWKSPLFVLGFFISALVLNTSALAASGAIPKGYQANGDLQSDPVALLGRFGELIARERAYQEAAYELFRSTRNDSQFEINDSLLDAVLGDDFLELYDEVLPRIEALGQQSRRDELLLRLEPEAQKKLKAGDRVAGINEGAVNNVIAHYKIAIEGLEFDIRQLLLAESHIVRRAADELARAFSESGQVLDYASYVRASRLLSAAAKIKGYVQPRCQKESAAMKQTKNLRYGIEDKFFFDQDKVFQTSAQEIYDAAGLIEAEALALDETGAHC